MTILKSILLAGMVFVLAGCEKKADYAYLMRHPENLKNEVDYCKLKTQPSPEELTHCRMVAYAAMNFTSLLSQQQQGPEKFGQRVMSAQFERVKTKNQLAYLKASIESLKKQNPLPASLSAMQIKLEKAKQNDQQKAEEVEVLLAVISLSRPE